MRFLASAVAAAVGGELRGVDVEIDGITIDSRSVQGGELFVPIVADRDGHDFVAGAMEAGAAAHLTSRPDLPGPEPAIVVPDTAVALLDLGRAARDRLAGPVVGITGSVGKTTVKDLLRSVLVQRFVTAASERSFNNALGVPLTLANAADGTEATVVEMGARGPGHIRLLCGVARPTIGLVTVVADAHLEMFGSIEEVASAKGELIAALPAGGIAVLNADDARVAAMAALTEAAVLTFGVGAGEVRAEKITLSTDLRASFQLRSPYGTAPVVLAVRGQHNVTNALGAAAAAFAGGCSIDDVVAGLAESDLSAMRMDLVRTESGALVLDDTYNANPRSMRAALDSLAALPAARRIAVLGSMAELGADSERLHHDAAAYAKSLGLEVLVLGEPAYGLPFAPDVAAVLDRLGPVGKGDAVLAKGSRVARLERVVEALLAG